jgi:hypothetical protein
MARGFPRTAAATCLLTSRCSMFQRGPTNVRFARERAVATRSWEPLRESEPPQPSAQIHPVGRAGPNRRGRGIAARHGRGLASRMRILRTSARGNHAERSMTCPRTSPATRRPGLRASARPEAERSRPEHRGGRRVAIRRDPMNCIVCQGPAKPWTPVRFRPPPSVPIEARPECSGAADLAPEPRRAAAPSEGLERSSRPIPSTRPR